MSDMSETAPLTRPIKTYVRDFALWYFVCAIIVTIVAVYIGRGSELRILAAFVAANLVVGTFLKHEKRAPTAQQTRSLANGSVIVWIACNIVFEGVSAFQVHMNNPEVTAFYIVLVVLFFIMFTVLTLLFLLLSYGFLARKQWSRSAAKR